MKKILALILILAIPLTMIACSSSPETVDSNSDAERITELEQELAELKSNQSAQESESKTEPKDEQETWSDDTIIAFTDAEMLKDIREITGVTERDITYGDVKNIREFFGGINDIYSDITPLKYFTSLTVLGDISTSSYDLEALRNLTNLTTLDITGRNLTDINALQNLTNLTSLSMRGYGITDISALGNLTNLTSLTITANVTDISVLGNLTNLTSLRITGDITDISAFNNLTKLTTLSIHGLSNTTNLSPISVLTNLTDLVIENGDLTDINNILNNLTNLKTLNLEGDDIPDLHSINSITKLSLCANNSIGTISDMQNLKEIRIYDSNCEYINGIRDLPNLAEIWTVHSPYIKSFGILENLPMLTDTSSYAGGLKLDSMALEEFTFINCDSITNNFLRESETLPNLKTLTFNNCDNITELDSDTRRKMPNLETINLINCEGSDGFSYLIQKNMYTINIISE